MATCQPFHDGQALKRDDLDGTASPLESLAVSPNFFINRGHDQKIQAQQQAEQQKYQLQQAQVKAEQDVAEATGRA